MRGALTQAAEVYGVADRITFLCGDFCAFAQVYEGDATTATDTDDGWSGWTRRRIDVWVD